MMLLDYFGVLVGFLEKWTKSPNLGNFGVLRHGIRIPCSGVAERRLRQASGTPRCSKATLQRRPTPQRSSATPQRSSAMPPRSSATPWRNTVHRHLFLVMFCYSVIPRTCLLEPRSLGD